MGIRWLLGVTSYGIPLFVHSSRHTPHTPLPHTHTATTHTHTHKPPPFAVQGLLSALHSSSHTASGYVLRKISSAHTHVVFKSYGAPHTHTEKKKKRPSGVKLVLVFVTTDRELCDTQLEERLDKVYACCVFVFGLDRIRSAAFLTPSNKRFKVCVCMRERECV